VMLEPTTGFIRKVTVFDILKLVFSFLFFLLKTWILRLPVKCGSGRNRSRLNTPMEAPW
jgi:hypothetical protein